MSIEDGVPASPSVARSPSGGTHAGVHKAGLSGDN